MRPWYLWLVLPGIVTASLEAQIQVPLITDLAPCAVRPHWQCTHLYRHRG
jgi:hypothetical protein